MLGTPRTRRAGGVRTLGSKRSIKGFASHNWGKGAENHRQVKEVVRMLREHGVDMWFDEDHMKGNILNAMTRGVDTSDVALVFVTEDYMNKVNSGDHHDNVLKEFMYIQSTMETSRIIPVCFEPIQRKWWGPVGMVLGNTLWIDMSTDAARVANMAQLVKTIQAQDVRPMKKLQNAIQRVVDEGFLARLHMHDTRYADAPLDAEQAPAATPVSTPRPSTAFTPRPSTTSTPRPSTTSTPRPSTTSTPRPSTTSTPRPSTTSTPRPSTTSTLRTSTSIPSKTLSRSRVDAISQALQIKSCKMCDVLDLALSTLGLSDAKDMLMCEKVALIERELGIA